MRGEHVVGEKGLTCPGKAAEFDGYRVQNGERLNTDTSGTSIFDPVLCELAYRWFCPPAGVEADLLFTCPPYFDLERYSDDPRDLSAMDWGEFLRVYRAIIADAVSVLKPNRFACFVVGDIRDKKGIYRNLPGETIAAFVAAGAPLYNDAVLVTSVGSLPIRVGKQFDGARKLGKTHQNVLVFCKGNPKAATAAIGPVECGEVPE